jgi:LysM repeat protein
MLAFLIAIPRAHADVYRVQPGDTFSGIADRFGITNGILQTLNPQIASVDFLFVGQELLIPDNASPTTAAPQPGVPEIDTPRVTTQGTHTVQPGDTLSGLANFYGVTLADLVALNPALNPDLLFVGALLVIPDSVTATAPDPPQSSIPVTTPPAGVTAYVVQPGDSYSALAARFDTTQATLFALNPTTLPDRLFAGSTILVPTLAPSGAPSSNAGPTLGASAYTVVPGDTAGGIALVHGLPLQLLRGLNPAANLDIIFVGQVLFIPTVTTAFGTTPDLSPDATDSSLQLTTYVVRPGDNASTIASIHEISLGQLQALNPSVNLDILQVAIELVVPLVDLPPPPPGTVPAGLPPSLSHVVVSGDTFIGIADRYGITFNELLDLNPNANVELLRLDQTINIPGTAPIPTASRTVINEITDGLEFAAARAGVLPHTLLANNPGLSAGGFVLAGTPLTVPDNEGVLVHVQRGDTLAGIAAIFGSSVDAIIADPRNGVTDPNGLIAGQELIVPVRVPSFVWPVRGDVTDRFGVCRTSDCGVRHHGTDIAQIQSPGGPVVAIAPGEVVFAGGSYCCGLGFFVEIDHGNGWLSRYGHLNGQPPVFEGQIVGSGETIGFSGTTGFSTGVHLHLEMEHNDYLLDALNYLP